MEKYILYSPKPTINMSNEEYLLSNIYSTAIFKNSLDYSTGYLLPLISNKDIQSDLSRSHFSDLELLSLDTNLDLDRSESDSLGLEDSLQIIDIKTTASSFQIQVNQDLNIDRLNLYDGMDVTIDLPDVIVTGSTIGNLQGSLFWNADTKTLEFINTDGTLTPDIYTIKLAAREDGIVSVTGNFLKDNDGKLDNFYTTQVTVTSTDARIVSLPDISRGPQQELKNIDFPMGCRLGLITLLE